ncbi:MAG: glycoside hydrolase family 28 protein [Gillisia sp.]
MILHRIFTTRNLLAIFVLLVFAKQSQAQEKTIEDYRSQAPFDMPKVQEPEFQDKMFNILDYGAVSDGQTLNTTAFAKAIEACSAAGGGKVVVPPGLWLTGPIELKSNINLVVERGALLQFTPDHSQYPMIKASAHSSSIVTASPIYGYDLENIAITGGGIIDGAGESWRPVKKSKTTESQWKGLVKSGGVVSDDGKIWWPTKQAIEGEAYLKKLKHQDKKATAEDYLPARDYMRPYMVLLKNCKKVLIEGVTIRNSPKFVFYPNWCTDVTVRYVNIFNEWWAQNGDGIDISACKNVVIYKCNVSVGDDGICMKSSDTDDQEPGTANLENVLIAGCNVYHAHGGFVIGSNTDGNLRNVFVTDCNFDGSDIGIRVKSNTGRGGLVKDIYIKDVFMSDIQDAAILFTTFYENVPAGKEKSKTLPKIEGKTPEFTRFHIKNVFCRGAATAISITGLPQVPIHDIDFDNVVISADKGYEAKNTEDINFKNVKIITPEKVFSW